MGNVTTGSQYSSTTKYTTTPNGKTFKIEVGEGGINKVDKSKNMGSFLTALGAKGVDLGAQIAGGYISDMFNQRSEERADKRNRALIRDTAKLQVEGRRKAGLNPYTLEGAQLPGMSAQSSTDTSSNSNFMNDIMLNERLKLDKELAISQIHKNFADANQANANANATTGQENRNQQAWPLSLRKLYNETEILSVKAFVEKATANTQVAMTGQQLSNLVLEGQKAIGDILNSDMDLKVKSAKIQDIYSQMQYREVQAELARTGMQLNLAQVEKIFHEIQNIDADTIVKMTEGQVNIEEVNRLKSVTAGIDIENALNQKYGGAERVTGMVYGGLNSISGLVGSIAKLIKPFNIDTTTTTSSTTSIPGYKDETTTTSTSTSKKYTR